MTASNLWVCQFIELLKEGTEYYEKFLLSREINLLDKSISTFEKVKDTYSMEFLDFEDCIFIGKSLRARQAHNKWS